jgi:hypothetical protein
MTGPEHWREADLILTGNADPCSYGCPHSGCPHEMAMIGRAIAHGLLALGSAVITETLPMLTPAARHEWLKATDPEYAAGQDTEVTR